jgi:hypothetical protein
VAFVVETGVGLANANSYLSVVDFKAYHDDRGNVWSNYGTPEIEQALVIAADYVDRRYPYRGTRRSGRDQALEWPRISATDADGNAIDSGSIPNEVEWASADLAFTQLTESLFQTVSFDESGGQVIEVTDEVGSVRSTRKYSDEGGGTPAAWRTFPSSDSLLWRLSSQSSFSTVRS